MIHKTRSCFDTVQGWVMTGNQWDSNNLYFGPITHTLIMCLMKINTHCIGSVCWKFTGTCTASASIESPSKCISCRQVKEPWKKKMSTHSICRIFWFLCPDSLTMLLHKTILFMAMGNPEQFWDDSQNLHQDLVKVVSWWFLYLFQIGR